MSLFPAAVSLTAWLSLVGLYVLLQVRAHMPYVSLLKEEGEPWWLCVGHIIQNLQRHGLEGQHIWRSSLENDPKIHTLKHWLSGKFVAPPLTDHKPIIDDRYLSKTPHFLVCQTVRVPTQTRNSVLINTHKKWTLAYMCDPFKISISLIDFTCLLKINILVHNILRYIPLDIWADVFFFSL